MDTKLKEMRSESKSMDPTITIGKNGLTDQVVSNIKDELSRRRLVKIKILPSIVEESGKDKLFEEIISKSEAKVIQKIGFTITLTKR